MTWRLSLAAVLFAAVAGQAQSAETITYRYDAMGRLVRAAKSGGPNSGTTPTYDHDKSSNCKAIKTAGAPR